MKAIYTLFACLLLPGAMLAQASGHEPDSSTNNTKLAAEVKALREALSQTQQQLATQQREIEMLKAQSKPSPTTSATNDLRTPGSEATRDSASPSLAPT